MSGNIDRYIPRSQKNQKCLRGKARRPSPHPRRPWKPLVTCLVQGSGTYHRRCRSLHWAIVKPARRLSCQASRAATSRSDCERKNKKSFAPATYCSVWRERIGNNPYVKGHLPPVNSNLSASVSVNLDYLLLAAVEKRERVDK